MKDKQCENVDEDLSSNKKANKKAEAEESTEIELDVKKEITKITDVINNLKETALKMEGAEVKMKDWSLLITYSEEEGEYIIDFKIKISVKPERM